MRLRDVCGKPIESNHYSSSLVPPLMHMRSRDGCMTFAVYVRVTFLSVHVAIEMQTHPIRIAYF